MNGWPSYAVCPGCVGQTTAQTFVTSVLADPEVPVVILLESDYRFRKCRQLTTGNSSKSFT